jgi:hypothetical protein
MTKYQGWFGIVLLLFVIAFALGSAHCAVSKKPSQGNAMGFLQYNENPYIYLEGDFRAAAYVEKNALVVRIQPRGTYALFTEDILFCPGAADVLRNKQGLLVFVYERVAHQTIQEIGCHDLVFVDEIKTQRGIPLGHK